MDRDNNVSSEEHAGCSMGVNVSEWSFILSRCRAERELEYKTYYKKNKDNLWGESTCFNIIFSQNTRPTFKFLQQGQNIRFIKQGIFERFITGQRRVPCNKNSSITEQKKISMWDVGNFVLSRR